MGRKRKTADITRDIIARGRNPTFRLIRRLVEPQGLSVACFVGDIKTLVITLKKEKDNEDKNMGYGLR